jgi:hypothetical protein
LAKLPLPTTAIIAIVIGRDGTVLEIEKFFKCPFCLEKISMLLDLSVEGEQSYTEDCEVCCNPILITYGVLGENLSSFHSSKAYG